MNGKKVLNGKKLKIFKLNWPDWIVELLNGWMVECLMKEGRKEEKEGREGREGRFEGLNDLRLWLMNNSRQEASK